VSVFRNRSDALAEALFLTPRDTERSWSPRNPEAGCLVGDQFKKTAEKNAENETKNTPHPKLRQSPKAKINKYDERS
jgi:hypothetical protein